MTIVSGDLSQDFNHSGLRRWVTPLRSGPAMWPPLPIAWHPEQLRRMNSVFPSSADACARRAGAHTTTAKRTKQSEVKRLAPVISGSRNLVGKGKQVMKMGGITRPENAPPLPVCQEGRTNDNPQRRVISWVIIVNHCRIAV